MKMESEGIRADALKFYEFEQIAILPTSRFSFSFDTCFERIIF